MEFYVWDSASEASFYQLLNSIFGSGYNNALISWKSFAQFCLCFLFWSSGFFSQWGKPLRRDGESGWNVRVGLAVNLFCSHIFVCISHLWFCERRMRWERRTLGLRSPQPWLEGSSSALHRWILWHRSSGALRRSRPMLTHWSGVPPTAPTVSSPVSRSVMLRC